MISPRSLAGFLLATIPLCANAADLTLAKNGGGVTQLTTMKLTGDPGLPYLLLFSINEASTPLNQNVTLEIPLTFVNLAVQIPGFLGSLSGGGVANVPFVIPNDPAILDLTISFQAIGGPTISKASNLVRLTPAVPGTFENTLTDAALPMTGGAVIEKSDSTVLLVGGSGPVSQVYDGNREEFTLGGAAFGVGILGQSTALADGKILFTGGIGLDGQPTDAAALFDPETLTTTDLTMLNKRAGHGASLMPNGKILITGGFSNFTLTDILTFLQGVQGTTEIFDPATQTFSAGPTLLEPRALHTSTTLTNGRVLIAGGLTLIPIVNIPTVSNTAYAFNPSSNSFGLPAFMNGARMAHSAVALSNGKVLLVGGLSIDFSAVLTSGDLTQLVIGTLSDCQLFTVGLFGLGSFQTIPGLSVGRAGAGVAALPNGEALICGGFTLDLSSSTIGLTGIDSADRYTSSATIIPTGAMSAGRVLPVCEPLNDGTVLVVGGGPLTSEIYQP